MVRRWRHNSRSMSPISTGNAFARLSTTLWPTEIPKQERHKCANAPCRTFPACASSCNAGASLLTPPSAAGKPTDLFTTVVAGGYCVGFGACAVTSAKIRMTMTSLGTYQPSLAGDAVLSPDEDRAASAVCGFSALAQNEDQIADGLYRQHATRHPEIGYHAQIFTGYVTEGTFRADGSSGGMGSWIAA